MNHSETIVILTPGFPRDESDSVCLPLQQSLIKALQKCQPGLAIIVISFQYPYHTNKYKWNGIPVIPFNGRNRGGLKKLLLRKKILACLKEINSSHNLIGLMSFWYNECAFIGKKFARENNLLHYCWVLGQDARKENKYPAKIPPEPAEILALSDFIQDEFEKNHRVRPLRLLPPGIDPDEFPLLSLKRDIDILCTGSLIPLKQYEIIIRLVIELKGHFPSLHVVFIGEGPEKERLQQWINEHDLGESISLLGELDHETVLAYMQRAKLFLHPSSYEGFGMVCLEALYAGLSVISFVKPMRREFTHWHIAQTYEEMKQKTIDILANPPVNYSREVPYLIADTAKELLSLFGLAGQ